MTATLTDCPAAHANVLEAPFTTPYQAPPFSAIAHSDYLPAFKQAVAEAQAEIDAIVANPEAPTFDNTVVALERSGSSLARVGGIFFNLLEALSDDEMMDISLQVIPLLSDFETSRSLNTGLWERVQAVYAGRDTLALEPEQQQLLKDTYESFSRQGALLQGADRDRYKELVVKLSELTTTFGQNALRELNTYEIWLGPDDLAGLPESSVEAAALAAREKGRDGEYLFTLAQPTYMAFMKYSDRPDLREHFYKLYNSRGTKGQYSNIEVMKQIADTRRQIANLLGYDTYADYSLQRTMAGSPDAVYGLLHSLRDAYKPTQERELRELGKYASELEGKPVTINPWDYSYYANKLKTAKYSYDEEALRPYFELSNVIKGVFGLATKLYGLTFTENKEVDVYHPDVTAYTVTDRDGSYLGLLYTDFFPRQSKRAGAWMTNFKEQWRNPDGSDSRPQVSIVMNFTKPTDTKPSLLTPYEVTTFLHEFGHALHGLLAQGQYASTSGTNVYRDFVELPSQFNENFFYERDFLVPFARHYVTGEPIPQEMIDKIVASSRFGAGYACLRQLKFGLVDMAWYTIKAPVDDAFAFEAEAAASVEMFPPVEGTLTSPSFGHIFSGGYAAGYYSYKWSEMLDADAFAKFKEDGIFNPATAESFRTNVLERGSSEDPAVLYRRFRGKAPSIKALLERDGIKVPRPEPARGGTFK